MGAIAFEKARLAAIACAQVRRFFPADLLEVLLLQRIFEGILPLAELFYGLPWGLGQSSKDRNGV